MIMNIERTSSCFWNLNVRFFTGCQYWEKQKSVVHTKKELEQFSHDNQTDIW